MEVVSTSPFRVGSMLWQDGTGAATLTVVGKATYFLAPGESPLDQRQDAPFESDEHWDDDENRSLRAASDLAPFKRHADVLLVGHAFAPGRQGVRSLRARLVVGEVDKTVEVVCDRALSQDGRLREGASFTKMALRWERAAGGPDTQNPAGVRADAPLDRYGQRPLPNLVPLGTPPSGDFIEPIGFGPMGPSWPTRQARLHRGLAGWDYRRWSERPLPPDLDPGFFNAAPVDQQVGAIRPNERLVLENLHPKHPRLTTNLATFTPRAILEWPGHPSQELRMRCDTLTIDTDRGTCALTWRVAIPLDDPRRAGRVVITLGRGVEDAGRLHMRTTAELAPKSREALPFMAPPSGRGSVPDISPNHETMDTPLAGAMPALPFRVGRSPLAGTVLGARPPKTEPPPPYVDAGDEGEIEPEPEEAEDAEEVEPDAVYEEDQTFTVLPDEVAAILDDSHTVLPEDVAAPVRGPLPSWMPESRPWPAPPFAVVPTPLPPAPASPFAVVPTPLPSAPPPPVVVAEVTVDEPPPPPAMPPPLIGPLATPEMIAREQAAAEEREAPPADPIEEIPAPPPPPPEEPGLPLEQYPLERCAAIAASIARRKPETGAILEEHELAPPRWAALAAHWQDAIRAESARGKTQKLDAYDDAYVGQLEAERGPIRVEEYARLVVAAERGSEGDTLEALGLPRSALLRVSRVWSRRTAADADLGRAVRNGIEAAREA